MVLGSKPGPRRGVKIGYQTGIRNDPQCEIFVCCDFLVYAGTDQNRVAERTVQPWCVRASYSATEKDNHPFDDDFEDSSNGQMNEFLQCPRSFFEN